MKTKRHTDPALAQARREQVLCAAADCFRRKGYHGAGMAEISRTAGMSAGHIYNYFESKEAIIESIFYKNSPLHDGATIIRDNYVVATRVILPVSNNTKIPSRFGLRHRAAIGVSEKTDAVCLLVSEETGEISYIKDGEFVLFKDTNELIFKLQNHLTE